MLVICEASPELGPVVRSCYGGGIIEKLSIE